MLNQIPIPIVDRIRFWIDSFLANPEPWFSADQRNPAHVLGIIEDLIEIRDNYRIDPETQVTSQAILDKLEGVSFYVTYGELYQSSPDRDELGRLPIGSPRAYLVGMFGEDIVAKVDDKLALHLKHRKVERAESDQRRTELAAIAGAKLTTAYLGTNPHTNRE